MPDRWQTHLWEGPAILLEMEETHASFLVQVFQL